MLRRSEILKMQRSDVRYQLYRIRTAKEGGCPHEADNIKDFYEKQQGFMGWRNFARSWDVDVDGKHDNIVRRAMTEGEEWSVQLEELAEEIPNDRESNIQRSK